MADCVKKLFLQACINHGSLQMEQAQQLLEPIYAKYDPESNPEIKNIIRNINKELKKVNQELTIIRHPLVDKEYVVFGYTFESPAYKFQHHYTEADQLYFGRLLDAMAREEEYSLCWLNVYDLPGMTAAIKNKLPKTHIQELIQRWIKQGYFLETDDNLYFGPRLIVEYSSHLKTSYPDLIKDCPLCRKIVLWDIKCPECATKIHRSCLQTFFRRNLNCPSCNAEWNTPLN